MLLFTNSLRGLPPGPVNGKTGGVKPAKTTHDAPKVVIVGGGFGGVSAAHELAKSGFHVTIIDRHPYTTFLPLLYQLATGGLNPGDITYSLRLFAARQKGHPAVRRAQVTGIDKAARRVHVDDGPPIDYDYLVIATGVTTNHFGIPGAAQYSRSMYTRTSAIEVRDMIFGGMEDLADSGGRQSFNIIVVGGGATGVEMAGTLAEMRASIPVIYPELSIEQVNVILVEMAPQLLTPFDESLQKYTLKQLQDRGVDVRLNTAISEVHADHVDLKDGTELPADLVIWAAGIAGYDTVAAWGLPMGKGSRIMVEPTLLVEGEDRIFAIGDCAVINNDPLPQLAQPAMQMGAFLGGQLQRIVRGEQPATFHYRNKGEMATIGRASAVAQFPNGMKIKGLPAWLLWVGVHLFFLLGNRNRLQSMINLGARYLFWPRSSTAIVGDVKDPPSEEAIVAQREERERQAELAAAEERRHRRGQPQR